MPRVRRVIWGILGFCLLFSAKAFADESSSYLFVDLKDLKAHQSSSLLGSSIADLLLENMSDPNNFFDPEDRQIEELFGSEIILPVALESKISLIVVLNTLAKFEPIEGQEDFFFLRSQVELNLGDRHIIDIEVLESIPLSQTNFTARVGVVQRKMILEDTENGIRKIYPLGVGAFDAVRAPGKTTLMTPIWKTASLPSSWAIKARWRPRFFRGEPFIRISPTRAPYPYQGSPIGFHAQPKGNFNRGFASHGCIRLPDKDLGELYEILMAQSDGQIPIELHYYLNDEADHPYPLNDSSYYRVKNYGSDMWPVFQKTEGLTDIERVKGKPPVDQLAK